MRILLIALLAAISYAQTGSWSFLHDGGCEQSVTSAEVPTLGHSWNNGGKSLDWCKEQAEAAGATYLKYLHSGGRRSGGCAWYAKSATQCELSTNICRNNGKDTTIEYGCKIYKMQTANEKKVCHKDQCKGTWTNPIPKGEQWVRTGKASDKGCCAFGRGACDWCVPSAADGEGDHFATVESIIDKLVQCSLLHGFALFGLIFVMYFSYKNCNKKQPEYVDISSKVEPQEI